MSHRSTGPINHSDQDHARDKYGQKPQGKSELTLEITEGPISVVKQKNMPANCERECTQGVRYCFYCVFLNIHHSSNGTEKNEIEPPNPNFAAYQKSIRPARPVLLLTGRVSLVRSHGVIAAASRCCDLSGVTLDNCQDPLY